MAQTCLLEITWIYMLSPWARDGLVEFLSSWLYSWLILCESLHLQLYKGDTQKSIFVTCWEQALSHPLRCLGICPRHRVENTFIFLTKWTVMAKVCEEWQNIAVFQTFFLSFLKRKYLSSEWQDMFWVTEQKPFIQQEPLSHVELKYSQLPAPEKLAASMSSYRSLEVT